MPAYTLVPLDQRLVSSAIAFLATLSGAFDITTLEIRERDSEGEVTPKTETPKKLRLIVTATDEGTATSQITTPIRRIRLQFLIRGNTKTEAGGKEEMEEARGALEDLLRTSNLLTSLDSAALGVRVMLAVQRPGCGFSREGMIRLVAYQIECRVVAAESATT